MKTNEEAAISHRVSVARLPQAGMPVILKADGKELRRLAKAFDLIDVSSFTAEMLVKKWRKDGVKITGSVKADITQSCVVTLEPLKANVSNDIDAVFVPENSKLSRPQISGEGEIIIDFDGPDLPETFSGDTIDPYPRKEGIDFEFQDAGAAQVEKKPSPFAKLIDFPKR
jgi:hypothetical protein